MSEPSNGSSANPEGAILNDAVSSLVESIEKSEHPEEKRGSNNLEASMISIVEGFMTMNTSKEVKEVKSCAPPPVEVRIDKAMRGLRVEEGELEDSPTPPLQMIGMDVPMECNDAYNEAAVSTSNRIEREKKKPQDAVKVDGKGCTSIPGKKEIVKKPQQRVPEVLHWRDLTDLPVKRRRSRSPQMMNMNRPRYGAYSRNSYQPSHSSSANHIHDNRKFPRSISNPIRYSSMSGEGRERPHISSHGVPSSGYDKDRGRRGEGGESSHHAPRHHSHNGGDRHESRSHHHSHTGGDRHESRSHHHHAQHEQKNREEEITSILANSTKGETRREKSKGENKILEQKEKHRSADRGESKRDKGVFPLVDRSSSKEEKGKTDGRSREKDVHSTPSNSRESSGKSDARPLLLDEERKGIEIKTEEIPLPSITKGKSIYDAVGKTSSRTVVIDEVKTKTIQNPYISKGKSISDAFAKMDMKPLPIEIKMELMEEVEAGETPNPSITKEISINDVVRKTDARPPSINIKREVVEAKKSEIPKCSPFTMKIKSSKDVKTDVRPLSSHIETKVKTEETPKCNPPILKGKSICDDIGKTDVRPPSTHVEMTVNTGEPPKCTPILKGKSTCDAIGKTSVECDINDWSTVDLSDIWPATPDRTAKIRTPTPNVKMRIVEVETGEKTPKESNPSIEKNKEEKVIKISSPIRPSYGWSQRSVPPVVVIDDPTPMDSVSIGRADVRPPSSQMRMEVVEVETLKENNPTIEKEMIKMKCKENEKKEGKRKSSPVRPSYGWSQRSVAPPLIAVDNERPTDPRRRKSDAEGIRPPVPPCPSSNNDSEIECVAVVEQQPVKPFIDPLTLCFKLRYNTDYDSILNAYPRLRAITTVVRSPYIGRDGICTLKFPCPITARVVQSAKPLEFVNGETIKMERPAMITFKADRDGIDLEKLEEEIEFEYGPLANIVLNMGSTREGRIYFVHESNASVLLTLGHHKCKSQEGEIVWDGFPPTTERRRAWEMKEDRKWPKHREKMKAACDTEQKVWLVDSLNASKWAGPGMQESIKEQMDEEGCVSFVGGPLEDEMNENFRRILRKYFASFDARVEAIDCPYSDADDPGTIVITVDLREWIRLKGKDTPHPGIIDLLCTDPHVIKDEDGYEHEIYVGMPSPVEITVSPPLEREHQRRLVRDLQNTFGVIIGFRLMNPEKIVGPSRYRLTFMHFQCAARASHLLKVFLYEPFLRGIKKYILINVAHLKTWRENSFRQSILLKEKTCSNNNVSKPTL